MPLVENKLVYTNLVNQFTYQLIQIRILYNCQLSNMAKDRYFRPNSSKKADNT